MTAQAVLGAFCAGLSLLAVPGGAAAQTAPRPVAEVAHVRFISDELMNLHHFLYAWIWRTRTEGRPLSQRLAALPAAPFTPDERDAWDHAVRYYDRELASKDLLSEGMVSIKYALGEVMRAALARRSIAFTPASAGLFDRAWPQYRQPIADAWGPYVQGRGTMDDAIATTVAALRTK